MKAEKRKWDTGNPEDPLKKHLGLNHRIGVRKEDRSQRSLSLGAWEKRVRWKRNKNVEEEPVWREAKNSVLCILIYLPYLWLSDSHAWGTSHFFKKCKCEKQTGSSCFLSPQLSSIWFHESLFYTTVFNFLPPSSPHLSDAALTFWGCGRLV